MFTLFVYDNISENFYLLGRDYEGKRCRKTGPDQWYNKTEKLGFCFWIELCKF